MSYLIYVNVYEKVFFHAKQAESKWSIDFAQIQDLTCRVIDNTQPMKEGKIIIIIKKAPIENRTYICRFYSKLKERIIKKKSRKLRVSH